MVTHAYDPGRPGPPLVLGILVFILGPVFALLMMGRSAISHLDIANTGPIVNHGRVALNSDATYLIATESVQPGTRGVQGAPAQRRAGHGGRPDQREGTMMWGDEAFVPQGSFYLEKSGVYVVSCPQAGPQVLLVPIKGSIKEFGWAMGRWLIAGGLLAVIGLLMIIFRRKKPRDVQVLAAPGYQFVPGPPGPPPPPGPYTPPYSPPGRYAALPTRRSPSRALTRPVPRTTGARPTRAAGRSGRAAGRPTRPRPPGRRTPGGAPRG